MQKELPSVSCGACHLVQFYRSQKNCIHCGKELVAQPPWTGRVKVDARYEPQKEPRRRHVLAPSADSGGSAVFEVSEDRQLVPVRSVRR